MTKAATVFVHAMVNFQGALSLASPTPLNFDRVDFANVTVSNADHVDIGSNSQAHYFGAFTPGAGAAPTAGDVQVIVGSAGLPVQVTCDSSVTLANGNNTIKVTGIEIAANGPVPYGSGAKCNGSSGASALNFVLLGLGADHIKIGGKLDGGTASGGVITTGIYTTTAAGGSDIQVNVVYQ
jgi:hypothetical protein